MTTYAVIGRNVADTLQIAVRQALAAADPGDGVVFVDSASTDRTQAVARELGIEVLAAPEGKGRAVAALLAQQRPGPTCLVDGDIWSSSRNIPATLRDAWRSTPAEMMIGEFEWPSRHELSASDAIHTRLIEALLPEQAQALRARPLGGFRILQHGLRLGRLPPGYGLEAHLNAQVSVLGGRIVSVDIGVYEGPVVRRGAAFAVEMGAAILDVAEAHGRIARERRPAWDQWLSVVADAFGALPPGELDLGPYEKRLRAASARPLPPRGAPGISA
jgi:glucosyl-3-phosphoglycerate synthase